MSLEISQDGRARGLLANEPCLSGGNPELNLNWRALFTHSTQFSFPKSRFPQISNGKRLATSDCAEFPDGR